MSAYEDIINLPYPRKYPRMSNYARGAQFSPFAALTGFEAAIEETARLTDDKVELDESKKAVLNEKLREIEEGLYDRPEITITYFRPDLRKAGGAYVQKRGRVKKLDAYLRAVVFTDGMTVPIEDISEIFLD
mgnify:CR=1 FL=1